METLTEEKHGRTEILTQEENEQMEVLSLQLINL